MSNRYQKRRLDELDEENTGLHRTMNPSEFAPNPMVGPADMVGETRGMSMEDKERWLQERLAAMDELARKYQGR